MIISRNKIVKAAQQYRALVRDLARAASHVPIYVQDGKQAPRLTGASCHYETLTGIRVRHPNAHRRALGKLTYCPSTKLVTVGRDWLRSRRIPESAMTVWPTAEGYLAAGFCGLVAPVALELGGDSHQALEEASS